MNSKGWNNRALSLCLIVATIATYSMVALASSDKVAGELYVTGKNLNGVTINGEIAANGRSVFSGSTITTPADTDATVNIGESGSIRLAPNTTMTLSFSGNVISSELLTGQMTVLRTQNVVSVKMTGGNVLELNAGETAAAGSGKAQDDDDDDNDGGNAWIIWALVLGGAAAGIILAASTNNNDLNLGGGTTVVSPNR